MKEKVALFMDFQIRVLLIEMKLLLNCRNSDCKETDGLRLNLEPVQSKLYSQNGCFLHYASSNHIGKYLKQNPPTQKYANVEEPVAKRSRSTLLTFNSKENCLFLWGNVFFETRFSQSVKMEKNYFT